MGTLNLGGLPPTSPPTQVGVSDLLNIGSVSFPTRVEFKAQQLIKEIGTVMKDLKSFAASPELKSASPADNPLVQRSLGTLRTLEKKLNAIEDQRPPTTPNLTPQEQKALNEFDSRYQQARNLGENISRSFHKQFDLQWVGGDGE